MHPDLAQKRGWNYSTELQTIFATENGFRLIFLQNILFTKYYLCNFKALLPSLTKDHQIYCSMSIGVLRLARTFLEIFYFEELTIFVGQRRG